MEIAIHAIARYISLGLDAIAIGMVVIGAISALIEMLLLFMRRQAMNVQARGIFIDFARWLVAALTFQLGSDIVGTTIAPTWDELGRLATIAGIRTFLTYFLDRDLENAREEKAREEQRARREEGVTDAGMASGITVEKRSRSGM